MPSGANTEPLDVLYPSSGESDSHTSGASSRLPPSPPPTATPNCSPPQQKPDGTVQSVVQELELLSKGKSDKTGFSSKLSVKQWEKLQDCIAADPELSHWFDCKLRSSWILPSESENGTFTARMPLPLHDIFAQYFKRAIVDAIESLIPGAQAAEDAELVEILRNVAETPSFRSWLDKGYKDSDASFTIGRHPKPLVVIEVDYSHGGPQEDRAEQYIEGETQLVIFLDIPYRTPAERLADAAAATTPASSDPLESSPTAPAGESTLALSYSIYRLEVVLPEDGEDDEPYTITSCDAANRICLTKASDGTIAAESGYLELNLREFQVAVDDDGLVARRNAEIHISHDHLANLLNKAIEYQVGYDHVAARPKKRKFKHVSARSGEAPTPTQPRQTRAQAREALRQEEDEE